METEIHTLNTHTNQNSVAWLSKANVYTVQSACSVAYLPLKFLEHMFYYKLANSEIAF